MPDEKQLRVVKLDDVLQKRRLGQALNAKEFAVLAGVSYSTAREWFRLPDFPLLQHVVFWDDFVEWRRSRRASGQPEENPDQNPSARKADSGFTTKMPFSPRAAQILSEAG